MRMLICVLFLCSCAALKDERVYEETVKIVEDVIEDEAKR